MTSVLSLKETILHTCRWEHAGLAPSQLSYANALPGILMLVVAFKFIPWLAPAIIVCKLTLHCTEHTRSLPANGRHHHGVSQHTWSLSQHLPANMGHGRGSPSTYVRCCGPSANRGIAVDLPEHMISQQTQGGMAVGFSAQTDIALVSQHP